MRSQARDDGGSSNWMWGGVFLLCQLGAFFAGAKTEWIYGITFGLAGLLMAIFPPPARTPRLWWILGGIFILSGTLAFLPKGTMGEVPAWRTGFDNLGLNTGGLVTIQPQYAVEGLGIFAAITIFGIWLTGHRASPSQLRFWSLAFAVGIAIYAVISQITKDFEFVQRTSGHFGFFPNRNHTGTYLAMGSTCGLGVAFQSARDKKFGRMALALVSVAICLWAAVDWSISRGGVLMAGVGGVLWLLLLGPTYLGRQGRKLAVLLLLAIVGTYLLGETRVKSRLAETSEKVNAAISGEKMGATGQTATFEQVDLRAPIALDTLDLIKAFPVTGVGAGQYFFVMPQYRTRTIIASENVALHPESDWLWIASELGLPSFFALVALVGTVLVSSLSSARSGRDRAIRVGCIVAATLVAIHGIFDVPGHKIPIIWSAVFLVVLTLRPRENELEASPSPQALRLAGVMPLAAASWFLAGIANLGPGSRFGLAERNFSDSKAIFDDSFSIINGVPTIEAEKLKKMQSLMAETAKVTPMHLPSASLSARVSLNLGQKDLAERSFEIERLLMPYQVTIPLLQGQAWSLIDRDEAIEVWTEALNRAQKIEALDPQKKTVARALKTIRSYARREPGLKVAVAQAFGS